METVRNYNASVAPQQTMGLIKALVLQLRLKQWTKNLLVFASATFAGNIFHFETLFLALATFLCFSFTASSVYVLNDVMDVNKDRLHPDKKHRPIASGALRVFHAIVFGTVLFSTALYVSSKISFALVGILLFYFMINLLYSVWLKHVVIIDVMIIALGFVLRAVAGAIAVHGTATPWFILCTLMLSLFLALGKRRYELKIFHGDEHIQRKVLAHYSTALLDQLITIVTAMTITSYALYTATENSGDHHYMMLTIPFVIYGIFRYLYLIHIENVGGKPEEILLTDKHIYATVLFYGVFVIFIKGYFTTM